MNIILCGVVRTFVRLFRRFLITFYSVWYLSTPINSSWYTNGYKLCTTYCYVVTNKSSCCHFLTKNRPTLLKHSLKRPGNLLNIHNRDCITRESSHMSDFNIGYELYPLNSLSKGTCIINFDKH